MGGNLGSELLRNVVNYSQSVAAWTSLRRFFNPLLSCSCRYHFASRNATRITTVSEMLNGDFNYKSDPLFFKTMRRELPNSSLTNNLRPDLNFLNTSVFDYHESVANNTVCSWGAMLPMISSTPATTSSATDTSLTFITFCLKSFWQTMRLFLQHALVRLLKGLKKFRCKCSSQESSSIGRLCFILLLMKLISCKSQLRKKNISWKSVTWNMFFTFGVSVYCLQRSRSSWSFSVTDIFPIWKEHGSEESWRN